MGFFLLLVSLILIVKGVMLIMVPKKAMKLAHYFLNLKDPRMCGIIPLVVGILLLFSAGSSVIGWLIVILGIAQISVSVYIFMTPVSKIKAHPWLNLSDSGYRAMGIFTLVMGVIIFISRI